MTIKETALPPVKAAEYIAAIAQHVSSVCVITTEVNGERFGLTATAVSSVSAEPPRLLVCINKSGLTHDKIILAQHFAVNVLGENQDDMVRPCNDAHHVPPSQCSQRQIGVLKTDDCLKV